jgi:hypothetical protein
MEIFDDQNYKMHLKMVIPLMRFTANTNYMQNKSSFKKKKANQT